MKKILLILVLATIIIIIPIVYITVLYNLPKEQSFLSVKELKREDNVYLDGNFIGKTPLISTSVNSGQHDIKISNSLTPNIYYNFDKTFNLTSGTNNLINIQLGPSETYSFYSIYTFKKISSIGSGLLVNAIGYDKNDSSISLSRTSINNQEVISKPSGTYTLEYKKAGYIGMDTQITLTTGYILEATLHLFKQPI